MGCESLYYMPVAGFSAAKGHQRAYIAQSVEHVLGKDEVIGSSPIVGSIFGYKRLESVNYQILKL